MRGPADEGFYPCMFCTQYVDTHRGTIGEQVVAVRSSDSRGGWRYRDVKTTGRYVCPRCLDRIDAGIHPLQASMI